MVSFASHPPEAKLQPASMKQFVLAGNATFTVRSLKTGVRYTFKVRQVEDDQQKWFVFLLTGPNNTEDYSYLGMIFGTTFRLTGKSKMNEQSGPVVAFKWIFEHLVQGKETVGVEFWHVGRCGRCGRPLTVPESIAMGFGPECADNLGIA